jgi:hypothetical protein
MAIGTVFIVNYFLLAEFQQLVFVEVCFRFFLWPLGTHAPIFIYICLHFTKRHSVWIDVSTFIIAYSINIT